MRNAIVDESTAKNNFKIALSLVSTSYMLKLFGCLMYKFEIRLIHGPFTAYVTQIDKRLYIYASIEFIQSLKNPKEVVFIILHEISHVLRGDLRRGRGYDHDVFNLAADHCLNLAIRQDIESNRINLTEVPESVVIIRELENQNLTTEQVYNYLMKHAKIEKEHFTWDVNSGEVKKDSSDSQSSNGSGNDGESDEQSDEESDDQSNEDSDKNKSNDSQPQQSQSNSQGKITITKMTIEMPDGQKLEVFKDMEVSAPEDGDATSKLQNDARRLLNSPIFQKNNDRGNTGGKLLEMIEESIRVEVPWPDLLENVIKKAINEKSDNRSWRNINKRMTAYNIMLPVLEPDEKAEKLYVVVDTSGSITTNELSKFYDIIKQSMYHFKEVVKIDHDVDIDNIQMYTTEEFGNDLPSASFGGRGGTSHKNVFDYIEAIYKNEDTRTIFNGENPDNENEPGLIIFLTDYMSDIDTIFDRYSWHKSIPYKFVLTKSHANPSANVDDNPIIIK